MRPKLDIGEVVPGFAIGAGVLIAGILLQDSGPALAVRMARGRGKPTPDQFRGFKACRRALIQGLDHMIRFNIVMICMRNPEQQEQAEIVSSETPGLSRPAEIIPVPTTISPAAQAFLESAAKRLAEADDSLSQGDRAMAAEAALQMLRPRAEGFAGACETIDLGNGASLYRIVPEGRTGRRAEVAYFDIHGGGFVAGGGEMCRILGQLRAMENGVEVIAVDYRLVPAHPWPAALDDCLAAYKLVLEDLAPGNLVLAGASAGGNLAAALLLRARDLGLPMPAGLLLLTPAMDMTGAGDSRQTNRYLDVNLYGGAGEGPDAYLGDANPNDPYVSPIYGSFTGDWPPTLLSSGTRDLLLSDTVRMHRVLRRAGVSAELHVTEAAPHGGFMGTAPEDHELIAECRRFCQEAWGI